MRVCVCAYARAYKNPVTPSYGSYAHRRGALHLASPRNWVSQQPSDRPVTGLLPKPPEKYHLGLRGLGSEEDRVRWPTGYACVMA